MVYATARELVFDYLRDGLARSGIDGGLTERTRALCHRTPPLLPGLCLALIDEADSILIDEARTPLILSAPGNQSAQRALLWQSVALANRLTPDTDFQLDCASLTARLTDAGRAHLADLRSSLSGAWKNSRHANEMVELALAARHLYRRNEHYLVRKQEIVIIDRITGRGAVGRQWSRGLHGLIALKEVCPIPTEPETVARTTYQRFFRRYLRLGGVSGTLREARAELARLYGLPVVQVPLQQPDRRENLPSLCFANEINMRSALVARVATLVSQGRATLIGTDSVVASEEISRALTAASIDHAVLNACNEQNEADIIAKAGGPGRVTVATRMAGRGTDIVLAPRVAVAGGLHVINCQRNDSTRLDRQLAGRCGRQGDPGSVEHWLTLHARSTVGRLWRLLVGDSANANPLPLPGALLSAIERLRQTAIQHRQASERAALLRDDERIARDLAFAGRRE